VTGVKQRLVVIGNGMAGARTVEEIIERGGADQFAIAMFGEEPYGNYNRILLSNVLAGAEDESGIFLNSLGWYDEHGIELRAGVRVDRIDRFGKVIHANDGTTTSYDKLIIATGRRPFIPPIEGMHDRKRGFHQGVFKFRTIDDTLAMIRYAREHERAVVIGGGLLGLEAAPGRDRETARQQAECVAVSYGRIQEFFTRHRCTSLERVLFAVADEGTAGQLGKRWR